MIWFAVVGLLGADLAEGLPAGWYVGGAFAIYIFVFTQSQLIARRQRKTLEKEIARLRKAMFKMLRAVEDPAAKSKVLDLMREDDEESTG